MHGCLKRMLFSFSFFWVVTTFHGSRPGCRSGGFGSFGIASKLAVEVGDFMLVHKLVLWPTKQHEKQIVGMFSYSTFGFKLSRSSLVVRGYLKFRAMQILTYFAILVSMVHSSIIRTNLNLLPMNRSTSLS